MKSVFVLIPGLAFLFTAPAWAFRFSPMVAELAPQGQRSAQSFTIDNNGDSRLALQVEVFKRENHPDGTETRTPTEDLVVFPQQLTLEPGAKRNLKVTWAGSGSIDSERPYRLVVTQLPVDFKKPAATAGKPGVSLNFLLQYVASLYVAPPKAKPRVTVDSVEKLEGGKLRFTLKNAGTAHQLLHGMKLMIEPGKGEVKPEQLKFLESENLLPGATRVFVATLPLPLPTGTLTGTVEFPAN